MNSLTLKSDRPLAFVLLIPAVLLLLLLVAYPLARIVYDSFFNLRLTDPDATVFIGLENYLYAFSDRDVRLALLVTLLFALITVPGALVVGLLLALAGNINYGWRWPIRITLLLPWILPMSFTGMIFSWFFNSDYGLFNDVLVRLGFQPIAFLLSPGLANSAIFFCIYLKTSSFVALILLPGLQSIPRSL